MTSREEIERLLNQTGRTLEGLPKEHSMADHIDVLHRPGCSAEIICHQSDVIKLLIAALRDSEPKRKYGKCHHCHDGTYSCPITQRDGTLIRYADFCDECVRDLRAVVAGYWRGKDERSNQ